MPLALCLVPYTKTPQLHNLAAGGYYCESGLLMSP
jgi:hypothetical protein